MADFAGLVAPAFVAIADPLEAPGMIEIESIGDGALIVRFGREIDAAVNDRVLALAGSLDRDPLPGQRDLVPAFASLAVSFDPCVTTAAALDRLLRERCAAPAAHRRAPSMHVLPVCYDIALAPDLAAVAARAGLSIADFVALHTAPEYRVFMIGFTPGFPYLGGLDARLWMPRRATPRERVPAGSVAIGGAQTGIYSVAAPGGWWIIGRCAQRLFDPAGDPPVLLAPGDRVRFRAIDREELEAA